MRLLLEEFESWSVVSKKVNPEVVQSFKAEPDYGRADMMAGYLPLSLEEKETLLETVEVKARLRNFI